MELDFILEDLQKLFALMKIGAERIKDLVKSLHTFSHLDFPLRRSRYEKGKYPWREW